MVEPDVEKCDVRTDVDSVLMLDQWTSCVFLQGSWRGHGSLPFQCTCVFFGLGEGLWPCPLGYLVRGTVGVWGIGPVSTSPSAPEKPEWELSLCFKQEVQQVLSGCLTHPGLFLSQIQFAVFMNRIWCSWGVESVSMVALGLYLCDSVGVITLGQFTTECEAARWESAPRSLGSWYSAWNQWIVFFSLGGSHSPKWRSSSMLGSGSSVRMV